MNPTIYLTFVLNTYPSCLYRYASAAAPQAYDGTLQDFQTMRGV